MRSHCQCPTPPATGARFCSHCGLPAPLAPSDSAGHRAGGSLELLPGMIVADRYRVEALLGAGGMGIVYRCRDLVLEEPVALKFLHPGVTSDPKMIRRFIDEIKLARRVSHKAVVHGYDLGTWNGLQFLAMQFVDGRPLNAILAERGKLPLDEALAIAAQLLAGLGVAHDEGIVHRDLKTDNILLDHRGNAYIVDFGIARCTADARRTLAGEVLGSPLYMSPEQAQGKEVDHRSDLYSIGVILFEMLTGEVPYNGADPLTVALKHVLDPVVPPTRLEPDVPPHVNAAIVRCMQKRPEDRHPDALALLRDLGAVVPPRPLGPPEPTSPRAQDAQRDPLRDSGSPLRSNPPIHTSRSGRLAHVGFYRSHRNRTFEETG
jgi:eukaryotic-like serine/threonine-protein kinase